jgi:hypothetical protein
MRVGGRIEPNCHSYTGLVFTMTWPEVTSNRVQSHNTFPALGYGKIEQILVQF